MSIASSGKRSGILMQIGDSELRIYSESI